MVPFDGAFGKAKSLTLAPPSVRCVQWEGGGQSQWCASALVAVVTRERSGARGELVVEFFFFFSSGGLEISEMIHRQGLLTPLLAKASGLKNNSGEQGGAAKTGFF